MVALARGMLWDPRWIWKAAYRIAAGVMQQRGREVELPVSMASSSREPAWELRAALLQVSPSQRASLILHYYAGYPTADKPSIDDRLRGKHPRPIPQPGHS